MLMRDVAMFSLGGTGSFNKGKNFVLVVMEHCVEKLVKHSAP